MAPLEQVVVTGSRMTAAQEARDRLGTIPGGASLIDNSLVERGRASNAEDVLALQPGIFSQSTSGNGANKISIRGSGLNTFYQGYALGIKFLYDGVPITGPGGTQEDLLNIAGVNYTEVLHGANAFGHSALSLGGAINFVTHTGHTAPGYYARFEFGSHGHRKQQLAYGGVAGDTDYYVTVLRDERDGFQDATANQGRDLIVNLGHSFSERLETRLLVRYREEQLLNGSTLTRAQIRDDPSQTRLLAGRKKEGTTLVALKANYTFDDDSVLEVALGYNNYPLDNGWHYSPTPQDWRSEDASLTLRYLRSDLLFGRPSDTTLTFSDTRLIFGDVHGYVRETGDLLQHTRYTGSRDTVFAIGNDLQLNDRTWLSSGLSLINIDRSARILYSLGQNTTDFPDHWNHDDWDVAPRVGLRYQVTPDLQIFGNVSRSIDPPVTWQHGSTAVPYIRPLTPQKGTTAEFGIRGSSERLDGSLAVYRSWIRDELLTVVVTQATETADALIANSNASATIHQGLEAGLSALLWEGRDGASFTLRQAYTLNDFHYRDDDVFGSNKLPSLPEHVYQAELQYQHPQGFYAGLSLRSASGYYVDYANTLKAPSYVIYGVKLGYEAPEQRWSLFLDLRNLTDEHYATAANTAYDLGGQDSPNFYPGDGFSVFSGIAFRF